jgi:hypothetical protein
MHDQVDKMNEDETIEKLMYEDLIAARLDNYIRLLENGVNVVWDDGDNYRFVKTTDPIVICPNTTVVVQDSNDVNWSYVVSSINTI